jgi:hypothetical protein
LPDWTSTASFDWNTTRSCEMPSPRGTTATVTASGLPSSGLVARSNFSSTGAPGLPDEDTAETIPSAAPLRLRDWGVDAVAPVPAPALASVAASSRAQPTRLAVAARPSAIVRTRALVGVCMDLGLEAVMKSSA